MTAEMAMDCSRLQQIVDTEIAAIDARNALAAAGVAQVETPSGAVPAAEQRRMAHDQDQARAALRAADIAHDRALTNYRRLTGR